MIIDKARPLEIGLAYKSAYTPPVTDRGLLACIPAITLNIKSATKLGARAQARVNTVKIMNVKIKIIFLLYVSGNGLNSNGPSTYPTRYIESGRIRAVGQTISNSLLIYGITLEGRTEGTIHHEYHANNHNGHSFALCTNQLFSVISPRASMIHTGDQLEGFSGSPSSHDIIFLGKGLSTCLVFSVTGRELL